MDDLSGPIHSSDQIIAEARKLSAFGRKKMVAVAAAQDIDVLGALASAKAEKLIFPCVNLSLNFFFDPIVTALLQLMSKLFSTCFYNTTIK